MENRLIGTVARRDSDQTAVHVNPTLAPFIATVTANVRAAIDAAATLSADPSDANRAALAFTEMRAAENHAWLALAVRERYSDSHLPKWQC